jgi:hypothetical protein
MQIADTLSQRKTKFLVLVFLCHSHDESGTLRLDVLQPSPSRWLLTHHDGTSTQFGLSMHETLVCALLCICTQGRIFELQIAHHRSADAVSCDNTLTADAFAGIRAMYGYVLKCVSL